MGRCTPDTEERLAGRKIGEGWTNTVLPRLGLVGDDELLPKVRQA